MLIVLQFLEPLLLFNEGNLGDCVGNDLGNLLVCEERAYSYQLFLCNEIFVVNLSSCDWGGKGERKGEWVRVSRQYFSIDARMTLGLLHLTFVDFVEDIFYPSQ